LANQQRSVYAEKRMNGIVKENKKDYPMGAININSAGLWLIEDGDNVQIKRVKDANMILTMDRKIKDALKNTKIINLTGKTILTLNEFVFNRLLGGHLKDDELDIRDGPTDGNANWEQDVSKCFDALGDNVSTFRSVISNELAIIRKTLKPGLDLVGKI